ncbi:M56 family metallopeptidase [Muricauda sp. 334s03]|uniref:M56 family metallopeptidase n=1 Tax=Flagellimonas yonaguniensis TaxID=3031325 RepID=A0ABT5XXU3_9FLAO|nr:M56 family metallopeptidase [[Muricauda] yonaguniensis]MDF0715960.1 M56 family metallopeptidase [[Muricauda] yonaguniensis]
MEPISMYFIQSAFISGGFLTVYHLFLKRDTLFTGNRLFLLSGLVLAFTFPLIKIQKTVVVSKPVLVQTGEQLSQTVTAAPDNGWYTLENILIAAYLLVCAFLLTRFIIRLVALKKLAKNAHRREEKPFLHLETEKKISPFSFFNYIFYNPQLFEPNELHSVLEHEKVHARQYHTLDVLFLEVLKIFFWFNPVLWLYKSAVKQNLEYLADHFAIESAEDKKSYQYLMLKQAVNTQEYTLANSFYNSLIKKRIVMLNQNQSKKINVLKTLVVVPFLGLLLVSFNIEETYLYKDSDTLESVMEEETPKDDKMVELTIDKNTTDTELEDIKKDLKKEGIDFSYTTVRNDDKEIISITLNLSGKNSEGKTFSGNYTSNSDGPIGPITVIYDDENNGVSFWNASKKNTVSIHKIEKNGKRTVNGSNEIRIRKKGGKAIVIVDGEQLSDEEVEKLHIEEGSSIHVKKNDENNKEIIIKKIEKKGKGKNITVIDTDEDDEVFVKRSKNVVLIKDSDDDDEDIEVISGDGSSYFFIDNDGKNEPLYYVDGKKAKSKAIKELSPSEIESMRVYRGDEAVEKYGKKAKDGVVEITTKKGK